MKKGRHRRFEEARALKRSSDIDFDRLLESLQKEAPTRDAEDDNLEFEGTNDEEDDEDDSG